MLLRTLLTFDKNPTPLITERTTEKCPDKEVSAMRKPQRFLVLATTLTVVLVGIADARRASAFDTYVALGDSLAFGESLQDGTTSNGDQGYASLVANAVAADHGGLRPNVVNLGVDGETTSTFLSRGIDSLQNTPVPGYPSYRLNTNYADSATASQSELFAAATQNLASNGHTIDLVTLQIGSNDILQYAYDSNGNPQIPSDSDVATATQALSTNYLTILTEIKMLAPSAQVLTLGYFDPYKPLLGSTDPGQVQFAMAAEKMTSDLNVFLQTIAGAFQATYVDISTAVDPVTQTRFFDPLTPGNVHPTPEGYQAIANAIMAVPEPGSLTLAVLGLGGMGLLVRARTRHG